MEGGVGGDRAEVGVTGQPTPTHRGEGGLVQRFSFSTETNMAMHGGEIDSERHQGTCHRVRARGSGRRRPGGRAQTQTWFGHARPRLEAPLVAIDA